MNIYMLSGYGGGNCDCMGASEHRCVYITVIVVWLSELLIMYINCVIEIGDLSKKDDLVLVQKRDTSLY